MDMLWVVDNGAVCSVFLHAIASIVDYDMFGNLISLQFAICILKVNIIHLPAKPGLKFKVVGSKSNSVF